MPHLVRLHVASALALITVLPFTPAIALVFYPLSRVVVRGSVQKRIHSLTVTRLAWRTPDRVGRRCRHRGVQCDGDRARRRAPRLRAGSSRSPSRTSCTPANRRSLSLLPLRARAGAATPAFRRSTSA